jgi:hypothetical protein
MNRKSTVLLLVYIAMTIIIIWQQVQINRISEAFNNEKVMFDANYGEVIRLKDDLGAYADSCRIYRKQIEELKLGTQND